MTESPLVSNFCLDIRIIMFGRIFIIFLLAFTGVQVAYAQTKPVGSEAPTLPQRVGGKLAEAAVDAMFIDVPIAALLWGLGLGSIGGIPLGLTTGTVGYGGRKICNDYLNQENTWYTAAICGVLGGGTKGALKGKILSVFDPNNFDFVDMSVKSPLNAALYEGLPLEIGFPNLNMRILIIELTVAFVGHQITQNPQKTLAEELKGTVTIALFVEASIHTLHTWYSKPLVDGLKNGAHQIAEMIAPGDEAKKLNEDL